MCGSLGTEPGLHGGLPLVEESSSACCSCMGHLCRKCSAVWPSRLQRHRGERASLTLELVGHVVVQTARPRTDSQQDIQGGGGGERDRERENSKPLRERERELELENFKTETQTDRQTDRDRDTERERERENSNSKTLRERERTRTRKL